MIVMTWSDPKPSHSPSAGNFDLVVEHDGQVWMKITQNERPLAGKRGDLHVPFQALSACSGQQRAGTAYVIPSQGQMQVR